MSEKLTDDEYAELRKILKGKGVRKRDIDRDLRDERMVRFVRYALKAATMQAQTSSA